MNTVQETRSLLEAVEAMADALEELQVEWPGLHVSPYLDNVSATLPAIDFYPASPFQTGAAFGSEENQVWFTVRARVVTVDPLAGYRLLYRFMDPRDTLSVQRALEAVGVVSVELSEYREYPGGSDGAHLGCEWRMTYFL